MDKINALSSDDPTKNVSSTADFEQEFRRTIRHGNKIQICRAIFHDFFTDCSIQGFKYFCERKRHWSERVFWMIMFVIATYLSCVMIYHSYTKWDQTPVIVSFSEKASPVWKIPFPAITICPEVKISAKMINITQTVHELKNNPGSLESYSKEKMDHLIALAHICEDDPFELYIKGKNTTDADLIRKLNHISIKLNDSLHDCKWRIEGNCTDLFRPILTEDGICFTFNSLNSEDIYSENVAPELLSVTGQPNTTRWNMETGYIDDGLGELSLDLYPNRIFGTGTSNGFSLLLNIDPDDLDYMCQGPVQGFKVVLHAPSEIPIPSTKYFRVPLEQEVLVSVKPNVLETSKELHDYEPERKLCRMNSENPLEFFKVYTQQHCELECTSNQMKKECGCVFYSYPRDKDTPICGIAKLECVEKIEENVVKQIFLESLNNTIDANNHACNCLPSCTSVNYDLEISSAKLDSAKYNRAYDIFSIDSVETTLGRLKIYFKEKQFFTSKRSELYGRNEFMAACGGLLGLFTGVTALSFVEIVYYFTLRLAWTLRMYRYRKNE